MRRSLAAAALVLLGLAAPAMAGNDHDHTPPGNPCAKGNGNPCNGNNGNDGSQGNAHHGTTTSVPDPFTIPRPDVNGRGAYITQIGDADRATITQTAPNAYGRIRQNGDRNQASIEQKGAAASYADIAQTGDGNAATVVQKGLTGNVVYLAQNGNGNRARLGQTAGATGENGAIMAQMGADNQMSLDQTGNGNQAVLTQNGDGNAMTATQTGNRNMLVWTQNGSNLADLNVAQTGGQALQITQSR